jgi:hypothetical protein
MTELAKQVIPVYRLKITLKNIKPPIWRRLDIPADTKLFELHHIFQIAMGWNDDHMHLFRTASVEYEASDSLTSSKDERRVRLLDMVSREGSKFIYEYSLSNLDPDT